MERANVLLEIFVVLGARNWGDVVALRQHPRKRTIDAENNAG